MQNNSILVWCAFYDLGPGNGAGPILTAMEPTWVTQHMKINSDSEKPTQKVRRKKSAVKTDLDCWSLLTKSST